MLTNWPACLQAGGSGSCFRLARNEIVIDFRLSDSRYLYINFSPADPRIYLITRRLKDLERSSQNSDAFTLAVRSRTSGGIVTAVRADGTERVVELVLRAEGDLGVVEERKIVAQLTGRSANLFITDEEGTISERARRTEGKGQQVGDVFKPPERKSDPKFTESKADLAVSQDPKQPSAALDRFYASLAEETKFKELARSALKKTDDEIGRRRKLLEKLRSDLEGHGDADEWKRIGDLLLANTSTARREADKVYVTDYYDESLREIAVDADRDQPITELADNHYRRYTKARNAEREIAARIETVSSELETLERKKARHRKGYRGKGYRGPRGLCRPPENRQNEKVRPEGGQHRILCKVVSLVGRFRDTRGEKSEGQRHTDVQDGEVARYMDARGRLSRLPRRYSKSEPKRDTVKNPARGRPARRLLQSGQVAGQSRRALYAEEIRQQTKRRSPRPGQPRQL